MGQGVNTKMLQVVAQCFSIAPEKVKVQTTNTLRIANTSPSAASATADLNGRAAVMACNAIIDRLKVVALDELKLGGTVADVQLKDELVWHNGRQTHLGWKDLLMAAYAQRVSLSEHAHYATPMIHFDWETGKGHPFAYHVYGTVITGVTLDCVRGLYEIDFVRGVHDFGKSMNTIVDYGQIEGGIVQGIGWMTMEEVVYDKTGKLRSNALSTYKVPDIYSVPKEINILPLPVENDNLAILSSKAVGEPPLMYGLGAYFAIRDAIRAYRQDADPPFDAPFTPEKVLMALHTRKRAFEITGFEGLKK
jgi:xanthine dehydrogenase large subunit